MLFCRQGHSADSTYGCHPKNAVLMVLVPRVRTHSDPESDDGSEDDGGQEIAGELVIACGNTTKVLEATERSFDPPAIAVASLIVPDRTSARTSAWNDRYCSR